jgi:hypothetical protein
LEWRIKHGGLWKVLIWLWNHWNDVVNDVWPLHPLRKWDRLTLCR